MSGMELTKGLKRVSRLDLIGGGQVVVDGNYAYVGHMKPPYGTSIIDVSDPKNPKLVTTIMLPDNYSHTHKVRVAGDIMIVNVEMNDRHFLRKGEKIPAARAQLEEKLKRPPTDAELAAELHVKESDLPALTNYLENGYKDGGFRIYDISDRSKPKMLVHHRTHGFGTHRFDMDERYAYISTEMPGYVGNILMVYDIKDPAKPQEVSRWCDARATHRRRREADLAGLFPSPASRHALRQRVLGFGLVRRHSCARLLGHHQAEGHRRA